MQDRVGFQIRKMRVQNRKGWSVKQEKPGSKQERLEMAIPAFL